MSTVLITGASGFVGSAVVNRLAIHSYFKPRAAVRSDNHNISSTVATVQIGSLNSTTDWSAALLGVDAVVHAAARVHMMQDAAADPLIEFRRVNVQGTLNLARQAAEAGVKRFIFISSVKVNGEGTSPGQAYTADDPPSPVDPYGISKYEAETALLHLMVETGMEVVIIRPPLIYGPGVKGNFFKLLQLTQKSLPLPLASVQNNRSMVYIGNLVSGITSCLEHPEAAGETFLISDGEDTSTAELIRKLASAMGRRAILLPVPLTMLKGIFSLLGKRAEIERLTDSLCVDSSKIIRVLNWQPPYTLDQGIQETVDWFLGRG